MTSTSFPRHPFHLLRFADLWDVSQRLNFLGHLVLHPKLVQYVDFWWQNVAEYTNWVKNTRHYLFGKIIFKIQILFWNCKWPSCVAYVCYVMFGHLDQSFFALFTHCFMSWICRDDRWWADGGSPHINVLQGLPASSCSFTVSSGWSILQVYTSVFISSPTNMEILLTIVFTNIKMYQMFK